MDEFAPNEFDKNKVDKIIVESNDKIKEIVTWMHDNCEWLQTEQMKGIKPTFSKGYIEFQGEMIGLGFEIDGDIEKFYVYMNNYYTCKFDFNTVRKEYDKIQPIFPPGLPKDNRRRLMTVLKADNTLWKLLFKFDALMVYATLHKETVVIDEPKRKSGSSKTTRQLDGNKVLPLTPKRYIITHIEKGVPGHHAAPDYQVEVRPTVRHLKSGKVVPVKGFTKYKDKPKKDSGPKIYKA